MVIRRNNKALYRKISHKEHKGTKNTKKEEGYFCPLSYRKAPTHSLRTKTL